MKERGYSEHIKLSNLINLRQHGRGPTPMHIFLQHHLIKSEYCSLSLFIVHLKQSAQ